MVEMTERSIEAMEGLRKTNLEAQIVREIAARLGVSADEAMRLYYAHPLAEHIEKNDYGLQFLDASYLVEEVLKTAV